MLLTTRIAVHRGAKKIRRVSRLFTENHKKHPNKTTSSERASLGGLGIGALAGTLGSLAGMGGGFVMIPAMTGFLHLSQHAAHGTSLFAVAATGLAGAISYGDHVQYPQALAVCGTAMLSSRWGAQATTRLSGRALKKALGYLMLTMAPLVPAKAYYIQYLEHQESQSGSAHAATASNEATAQSTTLSGLLPPALIGVGSGFLSGLFGVGGGVIVVPALTLFTHLNHHQALATSLAAMTLPAITGTFTHYKLGNCDMRVAPFLALGALVGAYGGGQLSIVTDETTLRWGFTALLATLGVRTIAKA